MGEMLCVSILRSPKRTKGNETDQDIAFLLWCTITLALPLPGVSDPNLQLLSSVITKEYSENIVWSPYGTVFLKSVVIVVSMYTIIIEYSRLELAI